MSCTRQRSHGLAGHPGAALDEAGLHCGGGGARRVAVGGPSRRAQLCGGDARGGGVRLSSKHGCQVLAQQRSGDLAIVQPIDAGAAAAVKVGGGVRLKRLLRRLRLPVRGPCAGALQSWGGGRGGEEVREGRGRQTVIWPLLTGAFPPTARAWRRGRAAVQVALLCKFGLPSHPQLDVGHPANPLQTGAPVPQRASESASFRQRGRWRRQQQPPCAAAA